MAFHFDRIRAFSFAVSVREWFAARSIFLGYRFFMVSSSSRANRFRGLRFGSRRGWLTLNAASAAILIGGCRRSEEAFLFQVAGPSMAPTLWGPTVRFLCPQCSIEHRVDRGVWQSLISQQSGASSRAQSRPLCWHCGHDLSDVDDQLVSQCSSTVLQVRSIQRDELKGMLQKTKEGAAATEDSPMVLLRHQGRLHVKRLIAGPGQHVSADLHSRLCVDGRLVASPREVRIPIDQDVLRVGAIRSRWSETVVGPGGGAQLERQDDARWVLKPASQEECSGWVWLIYHHRNVYRGNRSSQVLDDCPTNLGLSRRMMPVSSVGLRFRFQRREGSDSGLIASGHDAAAGRLQPVVQVMRWTLSGPRMDLVSDLDRGVLELPPLPLNSVPENSQWDESGLGDWLPEVTPESPVALGVDRRLFAEISELQLWRRIEYRTAPETSWDLGSDHWFVVGDNVPVSIDSRTWGPIKTSQILGVCTVLGE